MKKVNDTIMFLLVTLPNIHQFKNFFHSQTHQQTFLNWLTTLAHLKYAAKLPCNLSLMACFLTLKFYKVV